ncbi:MAG: hypothetical protein V5804_06720 [Mucilaginibacter sp.]|uniref:hypothetical protein n=1 Tax=Mucilaginibacter sp. TaxID=1882438 RepID=UPI0034E541BD
MATPIKATPVLSGNASKRFNALLASKKNNRTSPEEKQRIKNLVEKVLSKK